ncbi:MAG: FkbM family methyltransferase [Anaerolineae bacterium]|nr:FkbM family methyltransferase [Anaerolineae bacterium]
MFVTRGMTGATGNWYCGLHEVVEMGFVLHVLQPNELFVDIGANIGSYTVLAAGAVGADVIAVEPLPATFESLCRNVRLNDLEQRVRCVNVGLGETEGELRFTSGQDTMNHVMPEDEDGPSMSVEVQKLDNLCAERTPLVIKVDVEGYENAVVAGGQRIFADPRLQAVIMETNGSGQRYGWDDARLVGAMGDFGFSTCRYDPIHRQLEAAPVGNSNTLFVRDITAMQARAFDAPRFVLVNGTI